MVTLALQDMAGRLPYILPITVATIGLVSLIMTKDLFKKVLSYAVFSTAIIIFFLFMGFLKGSTPPIIHAGHGHGPITEPLPSVLMLTAIVVGAATQAIAFAIITRIKHDYGTLNEDVIFLIDNEFQEHAYRHIPSSPSTDISNDVSSPKGTGEIGNNILTRDMHYHPSIQHSAEVTTAEGSASESIPNKVVDYLKITDEAAHKVEDLLRFAPAGCIGIKVCLEQKGCTGLAYKIEYAQQGVNIHPKDELITHASGAKVFIDPKISLFVIGATMDYVDNVLSSGFVFKNPNEKGRCGCGESFYT